MSAGYGSGIAAGRGGGLRVLEAGDPSQVGPYRLLGLLGSGGMGRVFLGRSPGGRLVAVKVVRAELAESPDFRARFAREVAAARRVSGVFTAPVVDADPGAPLPWLATGYVAGPSLAQAVADDGPLPVASVLALAAGLAEGLSVIHAAGVIHRDLKPSNVLLADDGPRVIDFGISAAADATLLTGTGLVVGSPGFMSPEQAEGGAVGPASDVFSLGAVLAFAATGEGPFGTGASAALLYRVVHSPPRLDRLPGEVRPLVERCVVKDPTGRPTAAGFLAELTDANPAAADLAGWRPAPAFQAFPPPLPGFGDAPAGPGAGGPPTVTAATVGQAPRYPPPAGRGDWPPPPPPEWKDRRADGRRAGWWRPAVWAVAAVVIVAAAVAYGAYRTVSAAPARRATPPPEAAASSTPAPPSPSPAPSSAPVSGYTGTQTVNVFALRTGECFQNPPASQTALGVTYVTVVPCTTPHNAQVFVQFSVTGGSYPGQSALKRQADGGCHARLERTVQTSMVTSTMTLRYLYPLPTSWAGGHRTITCLIVDATPDLTSSLLRAPLHY